MTFCLKAWRWEFHSHLVRRDWPAHGYEVPALSSRLGVDLRARFLLYYCQHIIVATLCNNATWMAIPVFLPTRLEFISIVFFLCSVLLVKTLVTTNFYDRFGLHVLEDWFPISLVVINLNRSYSKKKK